jgi:hypothetical protein
MSKNKTVKMIFAENQFVDGVQVAQAGKVADIEILNEGSVARWLKRGGKLVTEEESKPVQKPAPKPFEKPEEKIIDKPVDKAEDKK